MNTEIKKRSPRGDKRKIVHDLIKTGVPVTLEMLKQATGNDNIRSLGADIREMRKFKYGSHNISTKRVNGKDFVYQLIPKK